MCRSHPCLSTSISNPNQRHNQRDLRTINIPNWKQVCFFLPSVWPHLSYLNALLINTQHTETCKKMQLTQVCTKKVICQIEPPPKSFPYIVNVSTNIHPPSSAIMKTIGWAPPVLMTTIVFLLRYVSF